MLRQVITKLFLAILLAVSAFALTGLPQEETKEKTFTRDELDAILVAGRFSREMQRTKDLKPLIAKYGVPNYGLLDSAFRAVDGKVGRVARIRGKSSASNDAKSSYRTF